METIKSDGKIYWALGLDSIKILIPKKKGIGFLKTPIGHHANELSKLISELGYDCFGLDGYVNIPVRYANNKDLTDLINAISKFYNKETFQVQVTQMLNFLIKNK